MFYVAKVLQALGIADVGYAVFVGIFQGIAMAEEIILTLIGWRCSRWGVCWRARRLETPYEGRFVDSLRAVRENEWRFAA